MESFVPAFWATVAVLAVGVTILGAFAVLSMIISGIVSFFRPLIKFDGRD